MQGTKLYNDVTTLDTQLPVCTHRYMFQIQELGKLLRGPECLRPCMEVHNGAAYLVHHLGDVTLIPGSSAASE